MTDAGQKGRTAEDAAAGYLRKQGYVLLARNFRCRAGEIDIVAADEKGELVFVEVRARLPLGFGSPEETVDARKRTRLRRAAECYLLSRRQGQPPCRFDVIGVVLDEPGRVVRIEHIKNAFE
ncbi:YraN family protein [Desulforudis sp. 1088]|uniref:YraN family protein n=2 Tax=Candidatus Desulforudis TaxID=471826 RepID=UPI00346E7531